jgi:hypothetical protein
MTAAIKQKKKAPNDKFKPILLVHIYRLARGGLTDRAIAAALEIDKQTFHRWKAKPDVAEAMRLAREMQSKLMDWHKFLYSRLQPELKSLWDQLEEINSSPGTVDRIESLLATHGKDVRQQLFVHALAGSNFSKSKAMRKVNIDGDTLQLWIEQDDRFGKLIEEVQRLKGDFFEEGLIELVDVGNPAAVLFANKTYNRDRGYGTVTDVFVKHSGQVDHNLLDLSDLELSDGCRGEILEAIRRREKRIAQDRAIANLPIEFRVIDEVEKEIAAAVDVG